MKNQRVVVKNRFLERRSPGKIRRRLVKTLINEGFGETTLCYWHEILKTETERLNKAHNVSNYILDP